MAESHEVVAVSRRRVSLATRSAVLGMEKATHPEDWVPSLSGVQAARSVVLADFVFTATAVVEQPATGVALAQTVGYARSRRAGSCCRSSSTS